MFFWIGLKNERYSAASVFLRKAGEFAGVVDVVGVAVNEPTNIGNSSRREKIIRAC